MNRTKLTAVTFTVLLASSSLYWDDATAQVAPPQIISGGIGMSGMDNMEQLQKNYRLKLVFSEPDGAYLANVNVKVRDHTGKTMVQSETKGPVMLMTLPPGHYSVTSSLAGNAKTENVTVRAHGLDTYYVRLPSV